MLEVYKEYFINDYQYNIYPYAIAGNDWIYNCKELEFVEKKFLVMTTISLNMM